MKYHISHGVCTTHVHKLFEHAYFHWSTLGGIVLFSRSRKCRSQGPLAGLKFVGCPYTRDFDIFIRLNLLCGLHSHLLALVTLPLIQLLGVHWFIGGHRVDQAEPVAILSDGQMDWVNWRMSLTSPIVCYHIFPFSPGRQFNITMAGPHCCAFTTPCSQV